MEMGYPTYFTGLEEVSSCIVHHLLFAWHGMALWLAHKPLACMYRTVVQRQYVLLYRVNFGRLHFRTATVHLLYKCMSSNKYKYKYKYVRICLVYV